MRAIRTPGTTILISGVHRRMFSTAAWRTLEVNVRTVLIERLERDTKNTHTVTPHFAAFKVVVTLNTY